MQSTRGFYGQRKMTMPPVGKTNLTFQVSGAAGSNYVLQVSTDLLNWSSVSTSSIPTGGSLNLTNAIGNHNRLFYRVHLQ